MLWTSQRLVEARQALEAAPAERGEVIRVIRRLEAQWGTRLTSAALADKFRAEGLRSPREYLGTAPQGVSRPPEPLVGGTPGTSLDGRSFTIPASGARTNIHPADIQAALHDYAVPQTSPQPFTGAPPVDYEDDDDTIPGPSVARVAPVAHTAQHTPPEPTPEELRADERTIHRLRAQLADSKRRIRCAEDEAHLAESRLGVALGLLDHKNALPPIAPYGPRRKAHNRGLPVVLCSDWHVEETVDPATVNGKNEYNPQIAERRAQYLFEGVAWQFEAWRHTWDITDAVVWLGGDLISGYIHEELQEGNAMSPPEATEFAQDLIENGLRYLLGRCSWLEKIHVPCSYGNHGRCHDAETELLTRDGWRTYDQLSVGDVVATYSMDTGATEWQALTDVYVANYDGDMFAVKTRTADFMVTPHHRMVVGDIRSGNDQFVEMHQLHERGMGAKSFPTCSVGHDVDLAGITDDELRLIGWVMTDGCYVSDGGKTNVFIYQSKPDGIEQISSLLERTKTPHTLHVRQREAPVICGRQVLTIRAEHQFYLLRSGTERLLELLPNKHKVPDWATDLSARQFGVLLDAWIAGDGFVRGKERVLYGTRNFLSQVQALAVVNGVSARLREDNRGTFALSLGCTRRAYINDWSDAVSIRRYTGVIWCGTVPNGTLLTRRNGIPLVSGNTTAKRRVASAGANSYERLMYRSLVKQMRTEERLSFDVADGAHLYRDLYGVKTRFHHGDDIRYQGGVGGLSIPYRKACDAWDAFQKADLTCTGHYHQWLDLGYAVVNGSLIGYAPFALSVKARWEPPRQGMFLIDEEWGRKDRTCIYVDPDRKAA